VAALLPRGFVRDASTEEGTTIARMDRNVKMDAQLYVTLILCQMAEDASNWYVFMGSGNGGAIFIKKRLVVDGAFYCGLHRPQIVVNSGKALPL
jgi:hypothetical protein